MKLFILVVSILITGVSAKCKRCFPDDFLWGAATASYQIEGAWNTSGKGENLWDWYTHTYPENIEDGSNGDVACDSYNKYEEDIGLLDNLGVDFYRFSISWSRILPEGTVNKVNQEGVDYYINIFTKLQEKNIAPVVTLYHWDLPLKLHQLGGWSNPIIADYFADYASLCFELFGQYVKYWITLNEPITQCLYGYGLGWHAPGYTQSGILTYKCAYTKLLAHAKAYRAYNETFKKTLNGNVGIVLVSIWYEPKTNSTEDIEAAENAVQWAFGLFAHPIYIGNWPQVMIDRIGNLSEAQGFTRSRLPSFTTDEIDLIKGTHDYLGFNFYTVNYATPTANLSATENTNVGYLVDRGTTSSVDSSWPQSSASWIYSVPTGIRTMLNWVNNRYNRPKILITENGWATESNELNDTDRITYTQDHLCNVLKAKYVDGVNVIGYTHWSLIDNFEWNSGYTEGFGLVAVNFSSPDRTRTPKLSYYWYKNVTESGCLEHCSLK